MKATVTVRGAGRFGGTVALPGDKSITHRALIFAALGEGRCVIENPAQGEDIEATIRCLRQLGASISSEGGRLVVDGRGSLEAPTGVLDCGNSGTTMRLFAGLLAGLGVEAELDGDASLRRRPMGRVLSPLREMGAHCEGSPGKDGEEHAPLRFHQGGALQGMHHELPIASAQVKSALLIAGLFAKGATTVSEPHLSRDHTERMLRAFAPSGRIPLVLPESLRVPGDPSSAAFLAAAAILLPGEGLTLEGMSANPTRIGWVQACRRMGATIETREEGTAAGEPTCTLLVEHAEKLRGIEIGEEEIPSLLDEVPILAVLATQAEGETRISGARELRFKETDRLAAMALWLNTMGAWVEEEDDGLVIHGPTPLTGALVGASSDHRVAMSLAIAGLVAEGETEIEGGAWAAVSFPNFFPLLDELCD